MTASQIEPTDNTPESHVLFVGTPQVDLTAICAELEAHSVSIDVVTDGRAALKRLIAVSDSPGDHHPPDLILLQLDFTLPDGQTVLQAIKSSPRLTQLPVVVLDPSEGDGKLTYETGGNAHVQLPRTAEGYADRINSIVRFWFEWAQYPAMCLYPDG